MATSISPGLFHLQLPFNKPDLKREAFEMKLLDIKADLAQRQGRPEELAILNLIGVFHCRLESYKAAEDQFRQVLSKDEHNLNALADMKCLLDKLYRTVDGAGFQRKLDRCLSNSEVEGDLVRIKARCLAEQAYAYACDMHTDHDSTSRERYIESNHTFDRALELGGDQVETPERDFWHFCIAKNAHKIFDRFSYTDKHAQAADYMDTAIGNFYAITQQVPGDTTYQGESWRQLADILRKLKKRRHCSSAHLPDHLKPYVEDPELCMKKALECCPNNPRILARYGNFVLHNKRNTKEALRLLDKSIALDSSDYNFYAFSTRGTVRLKFYKWKIRKATEDSSRFTKPERSVLELAREDMEKAIEIRRASWDLQNIAEVYHLLAQCDPDEPKESRRCYVEKEFEYLKQAADCEDGNRLISVKRLLGRCLFDLGQYCESIRLYDEISKLQSATGQYTGYFHEQLRSYLCLMQGNPRDDSPLEEMMQLLKRAITKYGTSALIKYGFGQLRVEYKHELRVFADHCKTTPDHESLLDVLTSAELPSPLTPAHRPGGLLKETWESPQPEEGLGGGEPVADAARTLGTLSPDESPSLTVPCRIDPGEDAASSPDSGLMASNQTPSKPTDGAAASLIVEGIRDMAIEDSPPEKGSGRRPKDYDLFVVYASRDADWVHNELLHKLGARELRCVTAEDSLPGSYTISSELGLMASSSCILLVLSSGFQTECEMQMHHALYLHNKDGHVVFPLRRDTSAVPAELKHIVSFDATRQRINWDKLAQDIKRQIDTTE